MARPLKRERGISRTLVLHSTIKMFMEKGYSNTSTSEIAKKAGAIVRSEIRQGKGNVVRSMFREIDADCYLMVDADDTYSFKDAKVMCDLILNDNYDMVIGDRLSGAYFTENKRLFHNSGNKIVRFLINKLFNPRNVCPGFT